MAIDTAERMRIFGQPGNRSLYASYKTPWGINVMVHRNIEMDFKTACEAAAADPWKPRRIDSLAVRKIRGSNSWSLHSWALAWDFFATDPGVVPPGGVWKPENTVTESFANHFTSRGFRWGRHFTRQDWPHIEWPEGWPHVKHPSQPPAPTAPPFTRYLKNPCKGKEVTLWQQRMRERGWRIAVDGMYYGEGERICRAFQKEKGLGVDGIVGPNTWKATWTAPR